MMQIQQLVIGIFLLHNLRQVDCIVCYQCTDCPEPFVETYPYVTLSNNTNFLAQCTKTVVNIGENRRLVSRGSVFFCPTQTSSNDAQIFCCESDFCNGSIRWNLSIFFSIFFPMRMYFLLKD